ncbi:energy transducer TonB [Rhodoferax bucti]|uniref:energy transducer TonB n=1 Tax=Rhodoferax bucti TaxID=2576305 RepID=UPI0011088705|nr:energy transducer TonB [Rhodoferax bucti]
MSTFDLARPGPLPAMSRNTSIAISVVALHILVLWALHTGLLRRVAEVVVPAEILVEIMAPASPPPPARPTPKPQPAAKQTAPKPPTPAPLAIAPSATAPAATAAAPTATAPAAASANTTASTSGNAPAAPPAPPAPAKVEMPSSDADYLNNPKPAYPAQSKRLLETGKVVVRVFIGTDGQASQASVKHSSGFDRLDQASLETALKWRYVPGKRDGVPQGMWFDVPFNWQLTR